MVEGCGLFGWLHAQFSHHVTAAIEGEKCLGEPPLGAEAIHQGKGKGLSGVVRAQGPLK